MHNILIHEVAIQVLCFFIIILSALFLLLVNHPESVERTRVLLLEVASGLLLGLRLIPPGDLANVNILLPLVLEFELQISVVFLVCFSRHT